MRIYLFLLLVFTNFLTLAQTPCDCVERLTNRAEYFSVIGANDKAAEAYKKAISFMAPENHTYWEDKTMATYFMRNQQEDSAMVYLIKSKKEGATQEVIDNEFSSLKNHPRWTELTAIEYTQPFPENFNWILFNKIRELEGIDQFIRTNNIPGAKRDSLFFYVDSVVFEEIVTLINLYGFPTTATDGFSEGYFLFFLHSTMYSEERYQKILGYIQELNNSCKMYNKETIALIIDRRIDWYHQEKQVAGTWNSSGIFEPIADLSTVDSIRFQYNMLTLKDFGIVSGRTLPEGYMPTEYPEGYFCENIIPE